jgi:hypothetical protein
MRELDGMARRSREMKRGMNATRVQAMQYIIAPPDGATICRFGVEHDMYGRKRHQGC